MNICILHGYLLEGSGSNIYVQNEARAFCKKGHTVYLMCQERTLRSLDFVSSHWRFDKTHREPTCIFKKKTPYRGDCHVFNPHLGGLLPVFITNKYKRFQTIREFSELRRPDIEKYINNNLSALQWILGAHSIDVIHAHHAIMSSEVASRAHTLTSVPYVVTGHGSALNFSVRGNTLLTAYAKNAFKHATKIIVPSKYMRDEFEDYFGSTIQKKLCIIPCGADADYFKLITVSRTAQYKKLTRLFKQKLKLEKHGKQAIHKTQFRKKISKITSFTQAKKIIRHYQTNYSYRHMDKDVLNQLDRISWEKDKIIGFVGGMITTKGAQLLVSALAPILKNHPDLKVIFVGFGNYREVLEAMLVALNGGNKKLFIELAKYGASLETGTKVTKNVEIEAWLLELKKNNQLDTYFKDAKGQFNDRVFFTGFLEHVELQLLLPLMDVLVVPSLYPESFGMIAAEGFMCGVPTLTTYQSALKDMHNFLDRLMTKHSVKLHKIEKNKNLINNLQKNINLLLKSNIYRNKKLKSQLSHDAKSAFDWNSIANQLISSFKK